MKVRQKIALGLCVFYLVSVIGIALSLHFCGKELSSVDFTKQAKCKVCKSASAQDMAKDDSCCESKTVHAKVTDKHQTVEKVDLPKNYSIALFIAPMIAEFFQSLLPGLFTRIENKAPPLSAKMSLHVFHCVFRN